MNNTIEIQTEVSEGVKICGEDFHSPISKMDNKVSAISKDLESIHSRIMFYYQQIIKAFLQEVNSLNYEIRSLCRKVEAQASKDRHKAIQYSHEIANIRKTPEMDFQQHHSLISQFLQKKRKRKDKLTALQTKARKALLRIEKEITLFNFSSIYQPFRTRLTDTLRDLGKKVKINHDYSLGNISIPHFDIQNLKQIQLYIETQKKNQQQAKKLKPKFQIGNVDKRVSMKKKIQEDNVGYLEEISANKFTVSFDSTISIEDITRKFSHIKYVKNDGNSFYRCIMFSYIENLILKQSSIPLSNFVKLIQDESQLPKKTKKENESSIKEYYKIREQDKSFISNVFFPIFAQIILVRTRFGITAALTLFFKAVKKSEPFDLVKEN